MTLGSTLLIALVTLTYLFSCSLVSQSFCNAVALRNSDPLPIVFCLISSETSKDNFWQSWTKNYKMASPLNHDQFIGNPSVQELRSRKVTKEQLKYIAQNFSTPFSYGTCKNELISLIVAHFGKTKETVDSQESSLQTVVWPYR